MANIKISELPPGSIPVDGTELLPAVRAGVTVTYTPAQLAAAAADITTVHIYVSQANGVDTNSGLASTAPIATAQDYIDRFPTGPAWATIWHFDSGNHTEFSVPAGWGRVAPIWMVGDGAGQVGDDGFVEVRVAEAAVAGSTERIIVTSGSVTTALVGSTIEVTSGVAIGAMRHINNVVGDNLYVTRGLDGMVVGDTFRVVDPGPIVQFTTPNAVIAANIGATKLRAPIGVPQALRTTIGIVNMTWDFTGATGCSMPDVQVVAFGWKLTGSTMGPVFGNASVSAAQEHAATTVTPWSEALPYIIAAGATNPATEAAIRLRWVGWGVSSTTSNDTTIFAAIGGYLTQTLTGRCTLKGGEMLLQGGSGGLFVGDPDTLCRLEIAATSSWYAAFTSASRSLLLISHGAELRIFPTTGGICEMTSTSHPIATILENSQLAVLGVTAVTSMIAATTSAIEVWSGTLTIAYSGPLIQGSNPGVNDIEVGLGSNVADISFTTDLAAVGDFVQAGPASALRIA